MKYKRSSDRFLNFLSGLEYLILGSNNKLTTYNFQIPTHTLDDLLKRLVGIRKETADNTLKEITEVNLL